jgi:hypothetical protein
MARVEEGFLRTDQRPTAIPLDPLYAAHDEAKAVEDEIFHSTGATSHSAKKFFNVVKRLLWTVEGPLQAVAGHVTDVVMFLQDAEKKLHEAESELAVGSPKMAMAIADGVLANVHLALDAAAIHEFGAEQGGTTWDSALRWFDPWLEFSIRDRPGDKFVVGKFNHEKGRFHVVIWNEAGLGWFARIMKGETDTVYNYGPFEKGRMRGYLLELFPMVDANMRELGVEGILNFSKGAGVLVQVEASVLSKIWRSTRFRKWKTTRP